jgi:hypothetical protein
MRLIADALIELPFKLDFCSQKPDIEPLTCRLEGAEVTLWFPPSLSDGTDGQGIFSGWAWWTGTRLRIVQERDVPDAGDVESLRAAALATGDEVLRRFLNAYRSRFRRGDVHPIRIDPRRLALEIVHDDGTREALAEPVSSFFYRNLPQDAPLERSVNARTLPALQDDVREGNMPPMADQLRLDADALDACGERERAALIRRLAEEH